MHWWTTQQLRSRRPLTRIQAVTKLAAEANPRALNVLATLIAEDTDATVRRAALQAAALIKTDKTFEVLLRGLRDSDAEVRETAVRTLQAYGDARVIPNLVQALHDPATK